jgi:uncharacterized protein
VFCHSFLLGWHTLSPCEGRGEVPPKTLPANLTQGRAKQVADWQPDALARRMVESLANASGYKINMQQVFASPPFPFQSQPKRNPAVKDSPVNKTRRQWLAQSAAVGAAYACLSSQSPASVLANKKLLFFCRSAGFEHSVVKRQGGAASYAERIMMDLGNKYGFEVTTSKDGRIFDKDYESFDGFFFYTTEDLTTEGGDKEPPMSAQGKKNFLEAIAAGKGFAGSHCASDTFHSPGNRMKSSEQLDPYIKMIGGEFIRHGSQQNATMTVTDPKFPGLDKAGDKFDLHEEWYSLKNFAPDMHVILVQETKGMKDTDYDRPPYPATWARRHDKGRVFYTSMGHREDVWANPIFESVLIGGLKWILGEVEADIPANIDKVTPQASVLPNFGK